MHALMHVGGEAFEMLLHEEEMRELDVGSRDGDEPWRCDQQEERHARQDAYAPDETPIALGEHIEEEGRAGQHDADQSLAEDGERARRPEEEHLPERERKDG